VGGIDVALAESVTVCDCFAHAPLMETLKRACVRETVAHMNPALREQRLRAIIKTWHSICAKRGLSQAQKDEIFENILIHQYGLHATARRDYRKIVSIGWKKSKK